MVRPQPLPPDLVAAVAEGRAVLFLGAGFSHGVTGLAWSELLLRLRDRVPDSSGWEELDALDRAQLFVQAHGRSVLERELAALLPTPDALRAQVTDFHRTLLRLPFHTIVTTNYDGLVEATLTDLEEPFRLVIDDEEVRHAVEAEDGGRVVVKVHGDLLLGDTIVLTREDYLGYAAQRPAMVALLESLLLSKTFVFYGFGLSDPNFLLIHDTVLRRGARFRPAYALMRAPNPLMARFWAERGIRIIGGATFADLERWVRRLAADVRGRAGEWDLDAVLQHHFPEERDEVAGMLEEVRRRFTTRLERLEPFLWVNLTPLELESYEPDAADDVLGAFRVLRALVRADFPVPARSFAQAAELLARFGLPDDARAALETCLRVTRRRGTGDDPHLRGSLGRVLCRLGDFDRARMFLERALQEGDPDDAPGRAAELAWLLRCILDRVDRLSRGQRHRAVTELIAAFLRTHASRLDLARLDVPAEETAIRWSVYYVNLRLGRLLSLASDLAGGSGGVYAEQAVEMLARAIQLSPGKPEAYLDLRPLLLRPRHLRPDPQRWLSIAAAAPPEVQRRLLEPEDGPPAEPTPPRSGARRPPASRG